METSMRCPKEMQVSLVFVCVSAHCVNAGIHDWKWAAAAVDMSTYNVDRNIYFVMLIKFR